MQSRIRASLAVAVLVVGLLVLLGSIGWSSIDGMLADVGYRAQVVSASPSPGCLGGIVATALSGRISKSCTIAVFAEVTIENSSPVTVSAQFANVGVMIAGRTLDGDHVEVPKETLEVAGHSEGRQKIVLRLGVADLIAAASGVILSQQFEVSVQADLELSAFAGLIAQRRLVHIQRALSVKDMLTGFQGNASVKRGSSRP